jgi:hypothetical protein
MCCTKEKYLERVNPSVLPPFMVTHTTNSLTLLVARDMLQKKDIMVEDFVITNWNLLLPLNNPLKELPEKSLELNPNRSKGYIVVGDDFHRIKVTSPAYLALKELYSAYDFSIKDKEVKISQENSKQIESIGTGQIQLRPASPA